MTLIKGLYGCSCHSYSSWAECRRFHNQKFEIGDKVKHRCNNKEGVVVEIWKETGYVGIKFNNVNIIRVQEHVANLIKM